MNYQERVQENLLRFKEGKGLLLGKNMELMNDSWIKSNAKWPTDCELLVLATNSGGGLKPYRCILPHQVYLADLQETFDETHAEAIYGMPCRSGDSFLIAAKSEYALQRWGSDASEQFYKKRTFKHYTTEDFIEELASRGLGVFNLGLPFVYKPALYRLKEGKKLQYIDVLAGTPPRDGDLTKLTFLKVRSATEEKGRYQCQQFHWDFLTDPGEFEPTNL